MQILDWVFLASKDFFLKQLSIYVHRSQDIQKEKKNKKKKKNKKGSQDNEGETKADQTVSEQKQTEGKSSKVRTFANGLVVEELAMGKPDGKRALPGKQVSINVNHIIVS